MTMPALFAVTPNPALDLTVTLSQLKDNATHRVPAIRRRLGGKGINVASVAAEQGFDAVALGPVSSLSLSEYGQHISTGTGEPLPDQLRQAFTDTPTPLRSTLTVHENERVSTSIINEAGAPHPPQVFDTMLATLGEELTDHPGSAVTLSGSRPACRQISSHVLRSYAVPPTPPWWSTPTAIPFSKPATTTRRSSRPTQRN